MIDIIIQDSEQHVDVRVEVENVSADLGLLNDQQRRHLACKLAQAAAELLEKDA